MCNKMSLPNIKKQFLIAVLFLFLIRSSYAQFFMAYLPKVKYEFGVAPSLNMGLSLINYQGDDVVQGPFYMHSGPLIETGLTLRDQQHYMQNKIGYEYFYLIFGGRLNLIHYSDFTSSQFSVRPEIGLSLFSVLTFTYGYQLNLNQTNLALNNGSIFSLNFAYFIKRKKYRD